MELNDRRLSDRFWSKVRMGEAPIHYPELGPCFLWVASLTLGYGRFYWRRKDGSVKADLPAGLDWFLWRVLTHERAPSKDLIQIETQWTIEDLLEANLALDVWDELERLSARKAQEKSK